MRILVVNPNTTASMTETAAPPPRAVAAAGTEIIAGHLAHGAGLDRGLLRRGARRARPARRNRAAARRRAPTRPSSPASTIPGSTRRAPRRRAGRRHLRGRRRDGGLHRAALHRRDDAGALASCRSRNLVAPLRHGGALPACAPPTSPVLALEDPSVRRGRHSCAPRSPRRFARTAPRRSCSAAPAWPIWRATLQRNSACRSSMASPPPSSSAEALVGARAHHQQARRLCLAAAEILRRGDERFLAGPEGRLNRCPFPSISNSSPSANATS